MHNTFRITEFVLIIQHIDDNETQDNGTSAAHDEPNDTRPDKTPESNGRLFDGDKASIRETYRYQQKYYENKIVLVLNGVV